MARRSLVTWGFAALVVGAGWALAGPVPTVAAAPTASFDYCQSGGPNQSTVTVGPSGGFSLTVGLAPPSDAGAPTFDLNAAPGAVPPGTVAEICAFPTSRGNFDGEPTFDYFAIQISSASGVIVTPKTPLQGTVVDPRLTTSVVLVFGGEYDFDHDIVRTPGQLTFETTTSGLRFIAAGRGTTVTTAGVTPVGRQWTRALPTPREALSNVGRDAVSLVIAGGGAVLITFPAQLFNLTLDENYEEITGFWRRKLGRLAKPRGSTDRTRGARRPWSIAAVLIVGAVLGAFLSPASGWNVGTAERVLAVTLALVVGVAVAWAATTAYGRRKSWPTVGLHALPLGLVVALACVVVSRAIDFQPGYLYGVVCGVVVPVTLSKREEGHLAALGAVATMALGVAAWALWVPVHHADGASAGSGVALLDNLLAAVFVASFVSTVINLLPLRFLPGWSLFHWHRAAWFAAFTVALFGIVAVIARSPVSPGAHHSPLITTAVLFGLFLAGSVWFREHYLARWRRTHGVAPGTWSDRARQLVGRRQEIAVGAGEVIEASTDGS